PAHTYTDAGSYLVSVSIAGPVSATVAWTTTRVTDAPLEASAGVFSVPAGDALVDALVGTFTEVYAGEPATAYQASIDWGDGPGSSFADGRVVGSGGHFAVAGTHTYAGEERGRGSFFYPTNKQWHGA